MGERRRKQRFNCKNTSSKVEDSFVSEANPTENNVNASYLRVGNKDGKAWYSYIRFTELPDIPEGYQLSSATLKLTMRPNQTTASRISVLRVTSAWNSREVTWDNRPRADYPEAYQEFTNDFSAYYFDVVSQVMPWYYNTYNGDNYGLLVRYSSGVVDDYNSFYSSDCGNSSLAPALSITYSKTPDTSADVSDGLYYIKNKRSGKYLNVQTVNADNMSAFQNVTHYDFHGNRNQQWRLVRQSDGYYKITVAATSLALDVDGAAMGAYANIHLYNDIGSDGQRWIIEANGDGTYSFASKCSQNRMYMAFDRTGLYQNHANVFQYPHNETSDWYLEPITIGVTMIGSADVTLNLVESRKLNACVTPEIAPQDLIWTSSSPASVAVQGDGTITGVGVGGATITACSVIDGSQYVTWSVSVTPPPHIYPSSITINGKPENNALLEGQSHSLTASVLPSNSAYRDVQWSSSNPSVATVLGGTITALAPGVTTITAKIIGPLSYTDSFELRVYIDPTLHERETIELSIVDSIFISQLVNPECSFNKPGSEYAFDFERAYALLQVFKNATPQSGHSLVSGETLEELGYCEPGAGDGAEALLNMMYGNSLSGKTMLDQAMEDNARWQAQLGTALAFMYYDAIFNRLDRQFVITDETFSPTSRLDMIEKSLIDRGYVDYRVLPSYGTVTVASKGGGAIGVTGNNIFLYRAMSSDEYHAIVNNGGRFPEYSLAMEEKWFATTPQDAKKWGDLFYPDNNYVIMEMKLPSNGLEQMYYSPHLDGIGPAYCGSIEVLNSILEWLN